MNKIETVSITVITTFVLGIQKIFPECEELASKKSFDTIISPTIKKILPKLLKINSIKLLTKS